jgi:hypothetical protein
MMLSVVGSGGVWKKPKAVWPESKIEIAGLLDSAIGAGFPEAHAREEIIITKITMKMARRSGIITTLYP